MQCAEKLRAFDPLYPDFCVFDSGRVFCYERKIAADEVFSKPTVRSLDQRGKGSSSDEGCISGTFFCSPNSKSILTCDGQVVINFSATCDPGYCMDNEQVFCQLPKTIAYNAVSTLSAKSLDDAAKSLPLTMVAFPELTLATTGTWS